jgi:hypothetical protein
MTRREAYRQLVNALGLSSHGVANFLGVAPRTTRRWWKGKLAVPRYVYLLFGIMRAWRITPAEAEAAAGLDQLEPDPEEPDDGDHE